MTIHNQFQLGSDDVFLDFNELIGDMSISVGSQNKSILLNPLSCNSCQTSWYSEELPGFRFASCDACAACVCYDYGSCAKCMRIVACACSGSEDQHSLGEFFCGNFLCAECAKEKQCVACGDWWSKICEADGRHRIACPKAIFEAGR